MVQPECLLCPHCTRSDCFLLTIMESIVQALQLFPDIKLEKVTLPGLCFARSIFYLRFCAIPLLLCWQHSSLLRELEGDTNQGPKNSDPKPSTAHSGLQNNVLLPHQVHSADTYVLKNLQNLDKPCKLEAVKWGVLWHLQTNGAYNTWSEIRFPGTWDIFITLQNFSLRHFLSRRGY